ncbi:fasciclin domain-containing protein [Fulvimarina endophytica]|uniref:Fasciclin domain-containing protein n=1 Tax=Fulvimarina endophytica TaxID=2293836 RepID=A0A371XA90_9HYPH|nr:fasciclin domain-containing protein [Fulvimarina endophytica]RFC66158.1 fasciclin domain-containing protein [Fulvimarina endophytica]
MKAFLKNSLIAVSLAIAAAPAAYAQNPTVGGAQMPSNRNIVENASNSPIHKTLVAAVKQAGLVDTLASPGPFTVFAPTDDAFAKLPAGTVETLMKPENKAQLTKILTAHVVAGDMSAGQILKRANDNGGSYKMKTVSGDTITAMPEGPGLALMDESGGKAVITIPDVDQSNGVIHVIDSVLLPK